MSRDEVCTSPRLARLELAEDEIEPMARELSAVLDHIARSTSSTSTDVPPTSHVVERDRRAARRRAAPCLPREVALAQAPAVSDDGFLVPSPQA